MNEPDTSGDPKDSSGFNLIEPFDIDDGSLTGFSEQLIFTLGVEWVKWLVNITHNKVRTDICLEQNAPRLIRLLERHGFYCEDRPFPFQDISGKACNQWRQIWVGARIQHKPVAPPSEE